MVRPNLPGIFSRDMGSGGSLRKQHLALSAVGPKFSTYKTPSFYGLYLSEEIVGIRKV